MQIFTTLLKEPDFEPELVDGSTVQADQHSPGTMGQDNQGLAKSRAGKSIKIHLAVDSLALPIDFDITGAEVDHGKNAAELAELMAKRPRSDDFMADKGYDSEV